jgi:hypothetical protein
MAEVITAHFPDRNCSLEAASGMRIVGSIFSAAAGSLPPSPS